MTSKSKYLTMQSSKVYKDIEGNYYPDIFTFGINNINIVNKPTKYYLSDQDISRFDILMYNYYGSSEYDQLVLWINNIEHIADKNPGDTIYLPDKEDLDSFLTNFMV